MGLPGPCQQPFPREKKVITIHIHELTLLQVVPAVDVVLQARLVRDADLHDIPRPLVPSAEP